MIWRDDITVQRHIIWCDDVRVACHVIWHDDVTVPCHVIWYDVTVPHHVIQCDSITVPCHIIRCDNVRVPFHVIWHDDVTVPHHVILCDKHYSTVSYHTNTMWQRYSTVSCHTVWQHYSTMSCHMTLWPYSTVSYHKSWSCYSTVTSWHYSTMLYHTPWQHYGTVSCHMTWWRYGTFLSVANKFTVDYILTAHFYETSRVFELFVCVFTITLPFLLSTVSALHLYFFNSPLFYKLRSAAVHHLSEFVSTYTSAVACFHSLQHSRLPNPVFCHCITVHCASCVFHTWETALVRGLYAAVVFLQISYVTIVIC